MNKGLGILSPVADGGVAHFLDTENSFTSGTLLDLRNDGVSKFTVGWDGGATMKGQLLGPDGSDTAPSFSFENDVGRGIFLLNSRVVFTGSSGAKTFAVQTGVAGTGGSRLRSDASMAWVVGIDPSVTPDTMLFRGPSAGIIEQRNGTLAQIWRVYRTWTDASNYERVDIDLTGTILRILSVAAGTGTQRQLRLGTQGAAGVSLATADTDRWTVNSTGHLEANSGLFIQLKEMSAPGAADPNAGRVYLDDSGGKTRLMIRFATGAAQQLAIEP